MPDQPNYPAQVPRERERERERRSRNEAREHDNLPEVAATLAGRATVPTKREMNAGWRFARRELRAGSPHHPASSAPRSIIAQESPKSRKIRRKFRVSRVPEGIAERRGSRSDSRTSENGFSNRLFGGVRDAGRKRLRHGRAGFAEHRTPIAHHAGRMPALRHRPHSSLICDSSSSSVNSPLRARADFLPVVMFRFVGGRRPAATSSSNVRLRRRMW
jgi:hypothetical protein